jgi:GT2 family glycosyltransferase
MIVSHSFLRQLGFAFDPRYFLWFEDVDLCREAKKHGFEVWHVAAATARDYVGQSFKKSNHGRRQRQFFASAAIYLKKWEPGIKPAIMQVCSPIGIAMVRMYSWFK